MALKFGEARWVTMVSASSTTMDSITLSKADPSGTGTTSAAMQGSPSLQGNAFSYDAPRATHGLKVGDKVAVTVMDYETDLDTGAASA